MQLPLQQSVKRHQVHIWVIVPSWLAVIHSIISSYIYFFIWTCCHFVSCRRAFSSTGGELILQMSEFVTSANVRNNVGVVAMPTSWRPTHLTGITFICCGATAGYFSVIVCFSDVMCLLTFPNMRIMYGIRITDLFFLPVNYEWVTAKSRHLLRRNHVELEKIELESEMLYLSQAEFCF